MKRASAQHEPLRPSRLRTALGWCVHFYTALGLVAAAGIAVLIVEGTGAAFRGAFILMLVATLIDATDGTLARAVRIREAVPSFDGRRLDDIIDFLNYTFLPLFLVWRAELLAAGQQYWLLLPLLASVYGFCQVSVKTDDGYFLGFPSYWNLVALYLYVLQPLPPALTLALVIVPALLTFVPSRYLYPAQGGGRLNRITNLLGGAWAGLLCWVMLALPDVYPQDMADTWPRPLAVLSLFFPVYYMTASWVVSWRVWKVRRRARQEALRTALASQK
jgi:phosphatidylcholine synthase